MNYRNYLIEATDVVLSRDDVPDDALGDVVKDQACLMAGGSTDTIHEQPSIN